MSGSGLHSAQLILLLLLLFVTAFAALARRLETPYPIVLVVAGLALSFVPGIPPITLDPELIFFVVLPPLLYAAALVTSWRDFSRNLISIAMLAFGLVGFTVAGVAAAGPWLFAGFDTSVGLLLGAAVSTTDAIAATSIAKRLGLPKRIVDLLEGESLLNDLTGLMALEFATAMVVESHMPTLASGMFRLLYLTIAGAGVGLAVAWIVEWFEHRIDDGPIEIAVSILVPYAAYLTAEALEASGVLAVVAAGLYLGRKSSEFFSPAVRLQARAVWNSIEFILNGFVFVLIGLQLPQVLAGVSELSPAGAILYGVLFSTLLILLRLVWTFPCLWIACFIRRRVLCQNEPWPDVRGTFVVGWTGMRGVIALAGAMSLPETLADGTPFRHRDLIIFLTFSVILLTLVFQGLTLPRLIRFLGLEQAAGVADGEQQGRRLVIESTLAHLEILRQSGGSESLHIFDDLARQYRRRLSDMGRAEEDPEAQARPYMRYSDVSMALIDMERRTALHLRDEGRISDELLREIEHELDLSQMRLN